ncbi:MAG TPA: rod shape-determining protein [Opitutaceae bacterium]|nr:rod shape-determining protein [Opitutaceae bacterium]
MTAPAPTSPPPAPAASIPQNAPPARRVQSKTILVGLDLGTNKSCIIAGAPDSTDISVGKVLPSVVGYVKPGIINGIVPGNADVLFGEEAVRFALHVDLVSPLQHGVIHDARAARDLLRHLRKLVDPTTQSEVRAVVGIPANAEPEAREQIRRAVVGAFDRVLLIPEPFLAAIGVREDSRLGQTQYFDPVSNSLIVDIGAGTTDLCLVRGYFPTAEDQVSFNFAGDAVDGLLHDAISQLYPDCNLDPISVRQIKEAHAYCGAIRKPIDVKVVLGGKARTLELGEVIGNACNQLVDRIFESAKRLIARVPNHSTVQLLQNIIVTGGGSQIRGIDTELQARFAADGYESPKVRLAGPDYQRYCAIGALKAARAARENQWQYVVS